MRIGKLALAALVMAGSVSAGEEHAEGSHTHWWMELKPSWYAGAAFGQSSFEDWRGIGDANDGSFTSVAADDSDSAWRVFAGADLARYVALEVGYADFGEATGQAQSDGSGFAFAAGPQSASVDLQAWDLTLVGKLPVTTDLALFGKVGAFAWEATSRVSVITQGFGPIDFASDDSGTDWWYGAGVLYDGLRPLRLVGEYATAPYAGFSFEDGNVTSIRLSLAYLF